MPSWDSTKNGIRTINLTEVGNYAKYDPLKGVIPDDWFRGKIGGFSNKLEPSGYIVKVIIDPAHSHPILSISYKDKSFKVYIDHLDEDDETLIPSYELNKGMTFNKEQRKFFDDGPDSLMFFHDYLSILVPIPPDEEAANEAKWVAKMRMGKNVLDIEDYKDDDSA